MRPIEFRGKAEANRRHGGGYWIYGDLVQLVQNKGLVFMDNGQGVLDEVDPESVGQYTGVYDKFDECIFEGDIVRFDYEDDDGKYAPEDFLIIFENGAFKAQYLSNRECKPHTFDEIDITESRIIGNQWDNPELLEVKK